MNADTNRPKMSAPTPETDATSCSDGVEMLTAQSDPFALYQKLCEATAKINQWENDFDLMKRERDEEREAFIEARKHREQFNSLLQSYEACWEEIKTALGEPEEGDQTCDLDRVLKAIRERDEARENLRILAGLVAYGLGQSGEEWSLEAMRQATAAIQNAKALEGEKWDH